MATSRIVEVLGQQAALLEEKVPGYKAHAIRAVQDILLLQNSGHSERARRERTSSVIDALAQRVTAGPGGSE